jgi:hypothetical protein
MNSEGLPVCHSREAVAFPDCRHFAQRRRGLLHAEVGVYAQRAASHTPGCRNDSRRAAAVSFSSLRRHLSERTKGQTECLGLSSVWLDMRPLCL